MLFFSHHLNEREMHERFSSHRILGEWFHEHEIVKQLPEIIEKCKELDKINKLNQEDESRIVSLRITDEIHNAIQRKAKSMMVSPSTLIRLCIEKGLNKLKARKP